MLPPVFFSCFYRLFEFIKEYWYYICEISKLFSYIEQCRYELGDPIRIAEETGENMQAVILAAGFGERIRSSGGKTPKALLEVGGRSILDYLLDFLTADPGIKTIHVRTNALYYPAFKEWLKGCKFMGRVELSSNGVLSPHGKLGAVADLEDHCSKKAVKEDLIVAAGDNIFDFSITPFLDFCKETDGDVVAVKENRNVKTLTEGGVVVVTSNDRIIDFEEKPQKPKSHLYALPLYRLSEDTISCLKKFLVNGQDTDHLGSFLAWSYRRRPLFAYRVNGERYHVTDPASYKKIRSLFEKRVRT